MPTHRVQERRNVFFRDVDGMLSVARHEDEVAPVTLDYSDALDTGETVATSAWDADGVTLSGEATTTTTASATISGTDGEIQNTITTSAGRTLVQEMRVVGVSRTVEGYA